jgi:hypothetical protein
MLNIHRKREREREREIKVFMGVGVNSLIPTQVIIFV